jgi:hypothetical protein
MIHHFAIAQALRFRLVAAPISERRCRNRPGARDVELDQSSARNRIMGLSVEPKRIMRAELVRFNIEENSYGVAWTRDDGLQGADRIGTRAEAEAVLQDLGRRQDAPLSPADILPFPKDVAAS